MLPRGQGSTHVCNKRKHCRSADGFAVQPTLLRVTKNRGSVPGGTRWKTSTSRRWRRGSVKASSSRSWNLMSSPFTQQGPRMSPMNWLCSSGGQQRCPQPARACRIDVRVLANSRDITLVSAPCSWGRGPPQLVTLTMPALISAWNSVHNGSRTWLEASRRTPKYWAADEKSPSETLYSLYNEYSPRNQMEFVLDVRNATSCYIFWQKQHLSSNLPQVR